jgi:cation diffusion facilitator CzcD-associated flavoprotein CzcO
MKRPSLGQGFYKQSNKDNVDVIDIKAHPIVEIKPEDTLTVDGTLHELDVVALATGFDSVTGGMKNMSLRNIYGEALADTWKMGPWSYLGMTCNGYPNVFFLYGTEGPTAISNGPSGVEVQGDWIVDAIKKIQDENIKSINPTKDA